MILYFANPIFSYIQQSLYFPNNYDILEGSYDSVFCKSYFFIYSTIPIFS